MLATVKEFELEEPSLLFKSRMHGAGSLHTEGWMCAANRLFSIPGPEQDCIGNGYTHVEKRARLRADRYVVEEHAAQGHRDQGIRP